MERYTIYNKHTPPVPCIHLPCWDFAKLEDYSLRRANMTSNNCRLWIELISMMHRSAQMELHRALRGWNLYPLFPVCCLCQKVKRESERERKGEGECPTSGLACAIPQMYASKITLSVCFDCRLRTAIPFMRERRCHHWSWGEWGGRPMCTVWPSNHLGSFHQYLSGKPIITILPWYLGGTWEGLNRWWVQKKGGQDRSHFD